METRLETKPQTILAGVSFYGDPFARSEGWTEENEIGRLWGRFMRLRNKGGNALPKTLGPEELYEVHLPDEKTGESGQYEVFVGYAVAEALEVPELLLVKVLPSSRFVRFTLTGRNITEEDSYREMYSWISANGLVPAAEWMYNLYDSRFKSLERIDESELDVCIPVRDANGQS